MYRSMRVWFERLAVRPRRLRAGESSRATPAASKRRTRNSSEILRPLVWAAFVISSRYCLETLQTSTTVPVFGRRRAFGQEREAFLVGVPSFVSRSV